MTIKEIEALSGMTRANVRFYEAEGLLTPERQQNGYRSYSEDDLAVLQRIRLLRSLRMPLEEIKRVHTGECTLEAALHRHLAALDREQDSIDRSRRICREMADDRAEYGTLDAPRYLSDFAAPPPAPPAEDVLPLQRIPWRRWLARTLDMALCSTLWMIFLMLVFNVNAAQRNALGDLLDGIAALALMLILEPLFLHFFGTTPGKWLLGITVTDPDGGRLTISAARERTWGVLWHGMGLRVPVYQLVREWKSYLAYTAGEPLPWEHDSVITACDMNRRRYAAFAVGCLMPFLLLVLALSVAESPVHRGDITPAQFSGNFNRLAAYHQFDFGGEVNENGEWDMEPYTPGVYVIHIGGEIAQPPFTFAETDGVLTSVSFRYETDDSDVWPPTFQKQMIVTALSFACTDDDYGAFSPARTELLETITDNAYRSFRYAADGVSVVCDVSYTGYVGTGADLLIPMDDEPQHFLLEFTITKE